MAKKILLLMASLFLVWQSFGLLVNIADANITAWWALLFTAWVINMFITGIFAFAGFALPTQKLLPASYYAIRKPEALKHINKLLRVDLFRKFLLATLWKNKNQRQKYFNGQKSGMEHLKEQSMKSEFGHLIPFCIINLVGFYLIFIGLFGLAIFTLLINLAGNLYPVLLQREHRMRIERLQGRRSTVKSKF